MGQGYGLDRPGNARITTHIGPLSVWMIGFAAALHRDVLRAVEHVGYHATADEITQGIFNST
jgi:hypothetical protein